MNETFKKRMWSFIWRFGAYIIVSAIGYLLESIGALNLAPEVYAFIAFVAGEVTKYLNNSYRLDK